MFSIPILFFLAFVDLCIAIPSDPISGKRDAVCQSAEVVAHDPTCWATLGYNTWFDTWKGPCPGAPGCACDVREPWSDCALKQYQTALSDPAKSAISCIDLTRPDLCQIPPVDWAKLSENQLATGYASTAIGSKLVPQVQHSQKFQGFGKKLTWRFKISIISSTDGIFPSHKVQHHLLS